MKSPKNGRRPLLLLSDASWLESVPLVSFMLSSCRPPSANMWYSCVHMQRGGSVRVRFNGTWSSFETNSKNGPKIGPRSDSRCFYLLINKSNCGPCPRRAHWRVNSTKMLPGSPVFPKQGNVSQYLSDDIHYNGHNLTKSKHLRGEDKVLCDSIIGSKGVQRQAHIPERHPDSQRMSKQLESK